MAKFDKCRFVRDDESQNFGKYSKFLSISTGMQSNKCSQDPHPL